MPQRVQCVIYQRVEPLVSPAQQVADRQPAPQYPAATASDRSEAPVVEQSYVRLQRLVCALGVEGYSVLLCWGWGGYWGARWGYIAMIDVVCMGEEGGVRRLDLVRDEVT